MASLLSTAISIFSVVCMWMVFEKAGEPGWQAIIPIWNAWVLAKIANKKWTFWVQLIASGVLTVTILALTVMSFTNLASNTAITDDFYYGDDYYYDEYDYYDFEDDYSASELSLVKNHNTANLASYDEYYDYDSDFQDPAAALDEALEDISIILILGLIIPFILILPMIAVHFIQNMGLAQAFGQHWAFAFLLTFVKPVGMGILAFSDNIHYIGRDAEYFPDAAYMGAYPYQSAKSEQPMPGYQNTNYNSFDANAQAAPATPKMSLEKQPPIPQVKHRCPNCGFESDVTPNPNTFCPNCGYLYRA
jgi:hypothetical protein